MPSDRSKYLLSKAALPRTQIPRAATHHQRNFRLPTCVAGSAGARESNKKIARASTRARAETDALRFRDRTLTWFQAGDDGLEIPDDDYADPPRSRSRLRTAARPVLFGSVALGAILWWLI